jgi:hypothetical protein
MDDLSGVLPPEKINTDGRHLFYSFSGLRPGIADDLIIWYEGDQEVHSGIFPSDSLYRVVGEVSVIPLNGIRLQRVDKRDFDTPLPEFVYALGGVLLFFFVFLVLLVVGIVWLVKYLRRRRRRTYANL